MTYDLIIWKDLPLKETPLSSENLNKMDEQIGRLSNPNRSLVAFQPNPLDVNFTDIIEWDIDFDEGDQIEVNTLYIASNGSVSSIFSFKFKFHLDMRFSSFNEIFGLGIDSFQISFMDKSLRYRVDAIPPDFTGEFFQVEIVTSNEAIVFSSLKFK